MGGIGGSFSGTVKPIVSLPMVISCGRLGGRWFDSAGHLFLCVANLLFWGGNRRAARQFASTRKSDRWVFYHGSGKYTQTPKIALLALKTFRFAVAVWAAGGVFLGRTGRFEPPHVKLTSDSVALWPSRALKYLKYHRIGRSNERFGGCAAKKSPFFAEAGRTSKKRPKKAKNR